MVDIQVISTEGMDDLNVARKTAIYLVHRYCNLINEETGKIFGSMHYSAISKVATRFKEKLAGNKELSDVMKRLESNVKT